MGTPFLKPFQLNNKFQKAAEHENYKIKTIKIIKILLPKGKNILINGKSSHIVINGYLGFFEHKYWIPFPNNLVSNSVSKIMPCIQNGTSFRQNATWENKKSDDI